MPRAVLASAVCCLLATGGLSAEEPPGSGSAESAADPAPCSAPEHRQFDFWIGDWVVTGPDGEKAGENTIEPILGGCVLRESWRGESGSVGRSFNMYWQRGGEWRQTWVDGAGGRLDLAGGLDADGRMVLAGTMPGRDGSPLLHEIAWTPRDDGTVEQRWRVSRDGGESWENVFVGIYRRRGE